jgi:hypothetical protein
MLKSTTGKELVFGIGAALFGVAWMILGRKFVPGWTISKGYSSSSALPVWTFGMGFLMIGGVLIVAAAFPGVREWFSSRPVLVFALVVAAIIGWLVVCANAGFLPD